VRRWTVVTLAIGAMAVALVAAVWAVRHQGRDYPSSAHQLPSAALTLPSAEPGLVPPDVTTQGTHFVANGQPIVLRGFDVGVASPAVYNQASDLHANFVRITAPWSEVEPTKPTGPSDNLVHHWNDGLLANLDQEVADLAAQHIQVLIDFHQFHWSPYYAQLECKPGLKTCSATGVPAWFYQGRYPQTKVGESAAKADFWGKERQESLFYYAQFAEMMARRYGHDANVIGYEIFNEPHFGHLPDDTQTTNLVLSWQNEIYKVMHAVDPTRTMFVMCRGGGEGIGTANLGMFGKGARIALDFHDYFNGVAGTGFDASGDNWAPSWNATHNQNLDPTEGYVGTESSQAAVLQVPLDAAAKVGIPLLVGEWGIHNDDNHADVYTSQMLDVFDRAGVSWSRWVLAPGHGFNLLSDSRPHVPKTQADQLSTALAASTP
jgi:endoglycosylceramidase